MSVNLEQVLGFKVKITNLLDVITEGKIYSFNSNNNTITLQTTKKNQSPYTFKVIKCSFIKNLEVVGDKPAANSFKRQYIKPSYVCIERVQTLLNSKIIDSKKNKLLKGKGVSNEGQAIFDLIYKTMPDVKWSGTNIIILGDVKIEKPYQVKNIIPLDISNNQSLWLIQRIVERGWKQIDEDDGRKGG